MLLVHQKREHMNRLQMLAFVSEYVTLREQGNPPSSVGNLLEIIFDSNTVIYARDAGLLDEFNSPTQKLNNVADQMLRLIDSIGM